MVMIQSKTRWRRRRRIRSKVKIQTPSANSEDLQEDFSRTTSSKMISLGLHEKVAM